MKIYRDVFDRIIAPENLFAAWETFQQGKRNKIDVLAFERDLERNIFQLYWDLKNKTYRHGSYTGFYIHDPKQRHIHKAAVRDRVLHHAVFSAINPIFEPTFISTSFSCRIGFGTHKGFEVLETMLRKCSQNGTRQCFVLKADIRKFFDNVDHEKLLSILEGRIKDENAMWLLREVIESYPAVRERERESSRIGRENILRKGIPIGNLTSQLFANIYMNEFDQFMKHVLKIKYYARYTDDFVIVDNDVNYLESLLPAIAEFLENKLALVLHPKKIILRPFHQGVDFLGYVALPKYRFIRTKTKQRIFRKIERRILEYEDGKLSKEKLEQVFQSYLGVLFHANTYQLQEKLLNHFPLFD